MRHVGFILLLSFVVLLSSTATADIAEVISYQGRLLDSGGSPVSDGTHDVVFELFDVASGGTAKWSSGARGMLTADGFFNYDLGDTTAIPDDLFLQYSELYLQITVVGDPPLTPRARVASSGYAYHALRADSVANSPGLTQLIHIPSVDLMNGFSVIIATDSINAPAAGYVVCQATMSVSTFKTAVGLVAAVFALTDSTQTLLTDQENYFVLEPGYGSGSFEMPIHVHRVFEVVPGWNRFSIRAADFGDPGQGIAARNTKLTMTYYDRSYGTVLLATPPSPPSVSQPPVAIDAATKTRLLEKIGK